MMGMCKLLQTFIQIKMQYLDVPGPSRLINMENRPNCCVLFMQHEYGDTKVSEK